MSDLFAEVPIEWEVIPREYLNDDRLTELEIELVVQTRINPELHRKQWRVYPDE